MSLQNISQYFDRTFSYNTSHAAQKIKFPIKNFFSKSDQIRSIFREFRAEHFSVFFFI